MQNSNLLPKWNLSVKSVVCRTLWKAGVLLPFLALIVYVPSRPMQASRSGFAAGIDPAAAQQTIACGQTLSGNITAVGQQVTYTFNANAGEAVNIAAVATSGDLAARAELFSPSNTLIGANGFGNTNTGNLALPTTGVYTILVKDFNLNKTGAYALNLQFTTGRCGIAISCGQTLNGNIVSSAQQDTYTFSANAGEAINIAAVATSGPLAARLELYGPGPSNTLLGANGFGNANTGSLTLPATGLYTILVRDFNLNSAGNYALNLQFTTGRCGTSISCGQTLSGNIDSIARQDTYTFNANAGEAVNVAAVAISGALAARAEIYSSSNTLIGANGFGNTNTGSLTLPATGTYTILVRDFNLNRTGPYTLNLQFTTGRCGIPISGGQTLSGSIDSAVEQDTFAFFGREGGSVNISAVATSGMLAARAEVYNPSDVLIGANGFGNTSTGNITLNATGIHTILVRDFNLNKTGAYNINLTCLGNACAPPVTLSLAPNPLTVTVGSSGNLTATISAAQSAATTVTLSSSNPAVAAVASSATIPANATSASFAVTGVTAGTATITATLPPSLGGSATASVTVTQPICLLNSVLPSGFLPFSQIYYITGPNAAGDRLVVGRMPPEQRQQLNAVPLPNPINQRFCDPVELAPGLLAIAYVPTPSERNGDFSSFAGLLLDPITNMPFTNGLIPANRLGDPHAWRIVNQVGGPAFVSAASYSAVALGSESIAAAFGPRLATGTQVATSQPLPTTLEGSTMKVRDSGGVTRDAPLFFVSPDQINFQVPPGTMNGVATVTITSGNGSVSIGTTQIATVAPGLFAANASGRDVAAGVALRVKADGTQVFEPIARFDQAQGKFVPAPIDLGPETDQVFLVPFGTGFRSRSSLSAVTVKIGGVDSQVLYAGDAPGFIGLDQLNVRMSRSLIGRGEVDVALIVDGRTANLVRVNVK